MTIAASTALVTRTDASENVSAVAIAALLRGVKCFSMLAVGNRAREEINMTNTKL